MSLKKTILPILLFFCITNTTFGETPTPEWLSPEEALKFYMNNPDYWKKSVWINYEEYKSGEYFVLRWELLQEDWTATSDTKVTLNLWTKNYIYITTDKWIFNLEIKKDEIIPSKKYILWITTLNNKWFITVRWEDLIEKSIIHIKLMKTVNGIKTEDVHNELRQTFQLQEIKEREMKPSIIWIQWLGLLILIWLAGFGWFLWFTKIQNRRKKKKISPIKIPENFNTNIEN